MTPEIAGTVLEKELEGARLFHYFEEGMWVYVKDGKMYYIVADDYAIERYNGGEMGVSWTATEIERIPEERQQYQAGNADFWFVNCYTEELTVPGYKTVIREIPSEYASIMNIGLYDRDNKILVFSVSKQLKE